MRKKVLVDFLGWGFILWLIGYVLGIILFMLVPLSLIGWVLTPAGIVITLFVLFKKVESTKFRYYLFLGICWTLIAVTFDYFLLVKLLKPQDGYYKIDVYLYYLLTFLLPVAVGYFKSKRSESSAN